MTELTVRRDAFRAGAAMVALAAMAGVIAVLLAAAAGEMIAAGLRAMIVSAWTVG